MICKECNCKMIKSTFTITAKNLVSNSNIRDYFYKCLNCGNSIKAQIELSNKQKVKKRKIPKTVKIINKEIKKEHKKFMKLNNDYEWRMLI